MTVEAIVRITQYGGDSGELSVRHIPAEVSNVNSIYSLKGEIDGIYKVAHLEDVLNPKPIEGAESTYYKTTDPQKWSDSPTLSPSLLDSERYAYGRYGSRYKKLDDYVGVVISCRYFSFEGDYTIREESYEGSNKLKHLDNQVASTVFSRDDSTVEGTVEVSQVNFSSLASPVPYSYHNAINSDVSVRLSNYTYPLNSGTATLYLDGEEKELSVSPFYTGAGGFDAIWTNDKVFDYNHQVNVSWVFYDTAPVPNKIELNYWFKTLEDLIGPRISNISPADNEINVSVSSCISFDLRDYEHTVNLDTLEFFVNNQQVDYSDLVVTELSYGDGYNILYCPSEDFLYGDEIAVSIYVEDTSDFNNYLFHVFTFSTESSNKPEIIETYPKSCRKYLPTDVDVEAFVVDGGHGLDEDNVIFSIDDKVVVDIRKLPIIYREE